MGINILGNNCGRNYLVDTECNFYIYHLEKSKMRTVPSNTSQFFLVDYSEIYDNKKIVQTGGYHYKYLKYKKKYLDSKKIY